MASSVEIANMALRHLGSSVEIASFTERSAEARVCNRVFDNARDTLIRAGNWPFAKKTVELGLLTDSSDTDHPTTEWNYAYQYPSDCLRFRRILSGTRNDTRQSRVPLQIVNNGSGLVIYTDMEDAVGEYMFLEDNTEIYPPDFALALSYFLASMIAPSVTAGDKDRLGKRSVQFYQMSLALAQGVANSEEQIEEEPLSEFTRARS